MFHVWRFEPHTCIVLEGFGALHMHLLLLSLLFSRSIPPAQRMEWAWMAWDTRVQVPQPLSARHPTACINARQVAGRAQNGKPPWWKCRLSNVALHYTRPSTVRIGASATSDRECDSTRQAVDNAAERTVTETLAECAVPFARAARRGAMETISQHCHLVYRCVYVSGCSSGTHTMGIIFAPVSLWNWAIVDSFRQYLHNVNIYVLHVILHILHICNIYVLHVILYILHICITCYIVYITRM